MQNTVAGTMTIELAGVDVEIKKLPLGKLGEVLEGVKSLPDDVRAELMGVDKNTETQKFVFEQLPIIVTGAIHVTGDMLVKAANSPTEKFTKDFLLNECGFDDGIKLVNAILEVNNADFIIAELKKMRARFQPKKEPVSPSLPAKID